MTNLTAKIVDGSGKEIGSYPLVQRMTSTNKDGFFVQIRNRRLIVDGKEFVGQVLFYEHVQKAPKIRQTKAYVQ